MPSTLGSQGLKDCELTGISEDSREVKKGYLFAALPGTFADGRDYINDAVEKGAVAILLPEDGYNLDPKLMTKVAILKAPLESIRKLTAQAARLIYGEPDKNLIMVGVTGTNGKSTTLYLMESILKEMGLAPGLMGTVGYSWEGEFVAAPNTTPEGPLLYRTLAQMVLSGVKSCVMEVSSHGLSLKRLAGLSFKVGLFTNLSRDHLDFHEDMESYFRAKESLFLEHLTSLEGKKNCAVNIDDPWGYKLYQKLGAGALSFGSQKGDLRIKEASFSRKGIELKLISPWGDYEIRSQLLGSFNAMNLMGAAALGHLLGGEKEVIARALSKSQGAPGRFSRVGSGENYLVLIDYAHSPGALETVINSAKSLAPIRLIVLFGCGGDRDRGKRPLMGKAASKGDIVILTSDNPRTEDPLEIIKDAEEGLIESGMRKVTESEAFGTKVYLSEVDRRKAIELGVRLMGAGDIFLICGKGHEDYQIIGRVKRPFDDRKEAQIALSALGKDN
ncbi:MAG: UDP-N-acetylmuramoyl-L-alanyl-D-glutamate--2,6-diaminopimelate ligase [Deltaproteobacteria bacterium]|jgi:UDP-N-acetylmuramoyl-L-alanyl-D-glutamate--2,6-diaminopimelate ligase|nr:UDP-N-acetylmuramoyl-L-alanyl-D-glutamate--2,6-diaminopimelate ligase [Deltaproteobacteria bacterium]